MTATAFATWLDTFVDEKGLDTEHIFTKQGPVWGDNIIPLSVVLAEVKNTSAAEQQGIKNMLVKIDFANGDVMHFFDHLAGALAR